MIDADPSLRSGPSVALGLRENWQQFALLVLINAFVGGMVGLQGTVVPLIGAQEFKITSTTTVLAFIVSFGVVKALANLVSGHFADRYGRKHMLVLGWLVGLPAPFMIAWGPSWDWIVAALSFVSGAIVALLMRECGPAGLALAEREET